MSNHLDCSLKDAKTLHHGLATSMLRDPELFIMYREDLYRQFSEIGRHLPASKALEGRRSISVAHQELRALEPGLRVHRPQQAQEAVETIGRQLDHLSTLV